MGIMELSTIITTHDTAQHLTIQLAIFRWEPQAIAPPYWRRNCLLSFQEVLHLSLSFLQFGRVFRRVLQVLDLLPTAQPRKAAAEQPWIRSPADR